MLSLLHVYVHARFSLITAKLLRSSPLPTLDNHKKHKRHTHTQLMSALFQTMRGDYHDESNDANLAGFLSELLLFILFSYNLFIIYKCFLLVKTTRAEVKYEFLY